MNKLVKIILNIARSISVSAFNFLIAIIGIKYLGKNNWGAFVQVLLWVYFVAFIANFGNKDFLLREFSKYPSKIHAYFVTSFISRAIFLLLSFLLIAFFPIKIALLGMLLSILIYTYQSLESLIIYNQKFLTQLIAEVFGFALICSFIFYVKQLTTQNLILAYCIAFLLKISIILFSITIDFKQTKFTFSLKQIQLLIPFFLIGFSGWLSSKIDLYVVNFQLTKAQLAEYQLLITAFLMLQGFSAMIIYPFSKHLFRLKHQTIGKIKRILIIVCFPIIIVSTFLIWFIFEKVIHLNLATNLYIIGAISALPIYFFIVDIFMLYKEKRETKVMYINFVAAFLNLIMTLLLIPIYGIKGAILSVLITQYALLFLYKFKFVK